MTTFEPGDVVLVRFPFTDLTTVKKRPALIVSSSNFSERYGDVVLVALTSQPQPEAEFALHHWRDVGLPKPTWLKPLIATIATVLIDRRLGRLSSVDLPRVASILRHLIARTFVL